MLIPEIILYNTLKAFFSWIQTDYNTASDKTQTILNDLFAVDNNNNPLVIENVNYLEQAVALFSRTSESTRQCQAYIGFNAQRAYLPAVHIMMPQEVPGRYNSIGLSEGEVDPEYHPEADVPYEIITRVKTYQSIFDMLVTSDNTTDVLIIYYMLKSFFPYIVDTLEILGLHNFKITGMDVQLDPQYAPPNIFHRTLRVEFDYESQTKIRNIRAFATKLSFLMCSNLGDENKPFDPAFSPILSSNYVITINKTRQSGTVGYVKFIPTSTALSPVTVSVSLTGQANNFTLSAGLAPGWYRVELNLNNALIGDVNGTVSDDIDINSFDTNGQFTLDTVFDLTHPKSKNIVINLNFS